MKRGELPGSFYDLVTGDEDARVCKDIPEAACSDQPENFFLQLSANVCTKIRDELASAKLVLPWLLSAAGAPGFFIGVAHAGIRIGCKTYLVDMATADTRATYVAVSNTAIGVVLLAGGVFGPVADRVGMAETIGLLGLFCLAGALGATRLDEVTR